MKLSGYPDVLQIAQSPVQVRQRMVQQIMDGLSRVMRTSRRIMAAPVAPMGAPQAPVQQQNPNDRVTLSILAMISSRGWYGDW
jgi:hypothetical protein